jgi:hypothetical protein
MRIPDLAGLRIRALTLSVALASLPLMAADKGPAPVQAPVPAQVLTAKKVFISNAGVNGMGFAILQRAGDPDSPFNQFYAAIKSWGRLEIVGAPSDADLVIEIRFDSALLGLTILDAKTHFILWTIAEPVEWANLAKTWRKNIAQGVTNLVGDFKRLTGQPAGGGAANQ